MRTALKTAFYIGLVAACALVYTGYLRFKTGSTFYGYLDVILGLVYGMLVIYRLKNFSKIYPQKH